MRRVKCLLLSILFLAYSAEAQIISFDIKALCAQALERPRTLVAPGQERYMSGILIEDESGQQLIVGSYLDGHAPLLKAIKNPLGTKILWGGEIHFIGTDLGTFVKSANETSGRLRDMNLKSDVTLLRKFFEGMPASSTFRLAADFKEEKFDRSREHLVALPVVDPKSGNQRHSLQNIASTFVSIAEMLETGEAGLAEARDTLGSVMDSLESNYRGMLDYLPFYSDSRFVDDPFSSVEAQQIRADLRTVMLAMAGGLFDAGELREVANRLIPAMQRIIAPQPAFEVIRP